MLLVERISSLVRLLKPVIVLRAWYYFRVGQSGYLSLIVGLIQFLFVATLYLQRIPAFADLHFSELAIIFLIPYGLGAVITGYVHTKKQTNIDTAIAALQNPFLYTIMPGKESRIGYPMMLLNLEVQKRFLKTLNMMDKDLEAEFDQMEELVKGLLSGKKLE